MGRWGDRGKERGGARARTSAGAGGRIIWRSGEEQRPPVPALVDATRAQGQPIVRVGVSVRAIKIGLCVQKAVRSVGKQISVKIGLCVQKAVRSVGKQISVKIGLCVCKNSS